MKKEIINRATFRQLLIRISLVTAGFLPTFSSAQNLQWAKAMGGQGTDQGRVIQVDGAGNVYTTGRFQGIVDFDPGSGVFNLTSAGNYDIFISKLDAVGNFVWAKAMGGTSNDYGLSIIFDGAANVYTTGHFEGTSDFDPGMGTFNLSSAGINDIFISKLDASGNFLWAKRVGDTSDDYGYSITLDGVGNVYTTGAFAGTVDFDPGSGVFNLISAGGSGIFISKLDGSGNFVWAKAIGGSYGQAIAMDGLGNVYTTGRFQGTGDFDPGVGVFNLTAVGVSDVFISKLNASGNFVWARGFGGTSWDFGTSIALDGTGNVYTTGSFQDTVDFDPGSGISNLSSAGSFDIFISKLDTAGNYIWTRRMGGTGTEFVQSIANDGAGNVYITGDFEGTSDFDSGSGIFNLISSGLNNIFISKLDVSGNFVWAGRMGGTGINSGNSLVLDGSGNIYTTGYFTGTSDFDPGTSVFNLSSGGGNDIFIMKLSGNTLSTNDVVAEDFNFMVYPNPAKELFNLSLTEGSQEYKFTLTNVLGSVICMDEVKVSTNVYQLNLANLKAGIYFITVENKTGKATRKIILE